MRTVVRLLLPVVAASIALTGCSGGGGDKAAGTKQAAGAQAGGAQAGGSQAGDSQAGDSQDSQAQQPAGAKTEEPALTGEAADKAKMAATAAFPGEPFVRAERETPGKPGVYGVKLRKANGDLREVYLSKAFKVVGSVDKDKD